MAMIYGMARCVLVWLGEAPDDSDKALETIRAWASDYMKRPEDDAIPKIEFSEDYESD